MRESAVPKASAKSEALELRRHRAQSNPRFTKAIAMDARLFAASRAEQRDIAHKRALIFYIFRLCWVADAFLSLLMHRLKISLYARGIPILPMVLHKFSIMFAQVHIGLPVIIHGGIYLPHGQVVIDGFTEIGPGVRIRPFVTIGLKEGNIQGPKIGANVLIGTGAKIIGPITIGENARIGAGAVVISDVEAGAIVGGVPARPLIKA